ncbi:hypothetical protein QBC47DRAFT_307450, partial [Echria macrotheca]
SIHEPYEMLFYNRGRIMAVIENDDHVGKHAQLLLEFMQNERRTTWKKADELDNNRCNSIAFEDAWLLYPPGETVFRLDGGGWRAYKVARVEVSPYPSLDPIRIHGYYLGFDKTGKSLVPQLEVLSIKPYPSEQPIRRLEVVPKRHIHQIKPGLEAELIGRGRKYWKYKREAFHQWYTGDAWSMTAGKASTNVIIDHATGSGYDRSRQSQLEPSPPEPLRCIACLGKALDLGPYPTHQVFHNSRVCNVPDETPKLEVPEASTDIVDDSLLLFCPSMVWAFSLQHKSWRLVPVEDLSNIERDETAWKDWLVSNTGQKKLDKAVSSVLGATERPNTGKRQGLKVLLCGGPGTGKTFTAECLAAKYAAPLYRVTAAMLGMDPKKLDEELGIAIRRASDWRAILLIEDAGIFLQNRHNNIYRSGLLSVFASHLDASDALIFVTMCGEPDNGIISRMDWPVYLEDLDKDSQKLIWHKLIDSTNVGQVNRMQLKTFVENRLPWEDLGNLNGHQIKACFRAALALSSPNGTNGDEVVDLTDEKLSTVLKLTQEFRLAVGVPATGVAEGLCQMMGAELGQSMLGE